ncbi:hypothetical protein C1646_752644 [Rhizophagus diaphanus]|nr:hypothetical protein C1646_752644 [Rhizophagus diaphanus] [Rhizophagus sp. MUCL 43196]
MKLNREFRINNADYDHKESLRKDDYEDYKLSPTYDYKFTSRRYGRPPNQYLSEDETASKNKKQKMTADLELERILEIIIIEIIGVLDFRS